MIKSTVRGFLCAVVVLLAGGGVARAATCNWRSNSTSTWSGGTWSCGHVPTSTDDVTFNSGGQGTNSNCTLDVAVNVNSITISNYSGTITGGSNTVQITTFFTESSGTFTAGAGTITMGGTLTVSAGAFTASSTSTTVSGSFTHSGGTTLLNNGGTLILNGTSGAGTITTGGSSLGLLTINGSGTYTLQDDLITTGAVAVSAGTLTAGANNVTIAGNLTISSGATFNASSAITSVAGAFTKSSGGTFNANGGTYFFNGTSTLTHTFGGAQMANAQVGLGTTGLVAYWNLDETSGTTVNDVSGNGNSGTWSAAGVSRTTSVPSTITFSDPRAITLNGSTGSVTLGTNNMPANNAPQSIALWYKGTPNGNNQNFIVMANPTSGSAVQLGLRGNALIAWNWGGNTLVSTTAPTDGAWHHVIYSYDGASDNIYLDGVLKATSTVAPHQTGTPTACYLGTYDTTNNLEMFQGSLDDIRVYTRALSNVEISILANGGSPSAIAGTHTFADAFSCSGTLTIGAGNVNGSSTFSVGGNWQNATSSTYTDTGVVTFTGTSTAGTITSGGASFGTLTINGSGGSYEFEDALRVTGNLTVTAGGLTGANPVTVGGNFSNAGAFNDLGTVTMTSASSAATITSGGARFSALTINGSASTVYTVTDRLWVPGGTVTLTQGTLAGGSSIIHVGAFSIGSGSFSVGSSTVIFDGVANQSLPFSSFTGLRFEDPSETNLVGYWKLDEGQGTWLQDVSGSGNTGALGTAGLTWTTASLPTGITFDDWAGLTFNGSGTAYAQMGASNIPATNAAITISAWVKLASVAGTQDVVALSDGTNILQVGLRNGRYEAWPSGTTSVLAGPTASTGAWHHVAYTFDGTSVDTIYIDGSATTGTFTHDAGTPTVAYLGTNNPGTNMLSGTLDDVRVYNVALTASQIKQLAAGRYAGTGGYATTTLAGNTTVSGLLALDAGNLNGNGKTMAAGATGPTAALVNCGTYTVSNAAQTFNGGLTVQPTGTLSLASSGGSVQIASGQTLTVDGTLSASSTGATIQGVGGAAYTFKVGSTASATPTVSISGLAVKNTNGGMQIGATTAATTTFTQFDNVAFSAGTGAQYLLLQATSLFLSSSGCSFDSGAATGATTVAVKAVGDGTGNGETRAVFGGTKCATNWALSASDATCTSVAKSDDDSDNNGVADSATAGTNGAVVEFVRSAADDTAGTIVGFPTSAFDWSTFSYYSTYAAFNNASGGTNAAVYVRDEAGNPLYSWVDPTANETITGTPQWVTSGGVHYLYVSVNGSASNTGKVYRLKDTGTGTSSGTLTLDTAWPTASPTGAYSCTCTITSDLQIDANNVYWAATTSASNRVLNGIIQSSGAKISVSWPVTTPANVSASSPTLFTNAGTTTLYMGLAAGVASLAVTGTTFVQDTKPGSVTGRVSVGTSYLTATLNAQRIYVGDAAGNMTAISPTNFSGTNFLWQYAAGSAITANYYDNQTDTVQFGTSGGTIVALNAAGSGTAGSKVNTSYPFTLNASDPITAAPLYVSGVLVVGSTQGKLYFLDRNTGNATAPNGVSIIKEYYFGPTESVSSIGFDSNVNRYMVTTSSTAKDGRLYYFDMVNDPTPASM